MEVETSSPGKVFLLGEYAVALGAPAIVAAVDRRLGCNAQSFRGTGQLTVQSGTTRFVGPLARDTLEDAPHEFRFAVAAARVGARAFGLGKRDITLRTWSELDGAGPKVGLGGSAAVVAAVTGAMHALAGQPDRTPLERAAIGIAAHRLAQGGGSGGDVVSATLGGLRWVAGLDASQVPRSVSACARGASVETAPVELPPNLGIEVVATGESARTGPRVRRFVEVAGRSPVLRAWMDGMAVASNGFRDACDEGHAASALAAVALARRLLGRLGAMTGIRVWTPGLRRACGILASQEGLEIKPSGAGGGDCAVALAAQAQRDELHEAWRARGLEPLGVAMSPDGVRVRVVREEE